MPDRPNILFLMTDQMQGRLLDASHPCRTPTMDRLAQRGVRFRRAYASNPVCSPARAGLMTGLLPHNHGVLWVTHTVDADQGLLREDKPHFAQRLADAGYRTGYFGKWHVEHTEQPGRFGWQTDVSIKSERWQAYREQLAGDKPQFDLRYDVEGPEGYPDGLLYGVVDQPPERRGMGVTTAAALDWLDEALAGDAPWCGFVSFTEPHDPYVCGRDAFAQYDVDAIELPANVHDHLEGRPKLYRKAARAYDAMTDRRHREAAACYWATTTECDQQFGRVIDRVERAGQLDNTLVIVISDHGEFLGAHGMYCKNVGPWEEAFHVPLIFSGPGAASGAVSDARVGSHEIAPTLLEMLGLEPIGAPDSRSFAPAVADPAGRSDHYTTGFAEYEGARFHYTQRVAWDGPWKFVFNAFDEDELYHLHDDPGEMHNRIADPQCRDVVKQMMALMWRRITETGDQRLVRSGYTGIRAVFEYGPGIAERREGT